MAHRILKHRTALAAFLLSLFIHSLIGAPLVRDFFSPTVRPEKLKPLEKQMPIEIVSSEEHRAPGQPAEKNVRTKQNLKSPNIAANDILGGGFFNKHILNSGSHDFNLPNEPALGLTVSGESREESQFAGDPMARVQSSAQGWSGAVQYGNSMGLAFTLESLPYFEALYDRVNSQLVYPDDFARQRITGRVRIEAELSKEGRLIRFLSSTADDRLLQTYCFAVLMQILSRPLPQSAWLPFDRANVAFDFDFRVRIPTETPHFYAREVQKNRLGFGRENEIDPWLNEKFNEIITHYVPPIVPIPGGFYIDLIAAYQFVNNLIEGTPTESEQRQARIEKLHESLRGTVHSHSPTPSPSPTPES